MVLNFRRMFHFIGLIVVFSFTMMVTLLVKDYFRLRFTPSGETNFLANILYGYYLPYLLYLLIAGVVLGIVIGLSKRDASYCFTTAMTPLVILLVLVFGMMLLQ